MKTASQVWKRIRKRQHILKALIFLSLTTVDGWTTHHWPQHAQVKDRDCFDFVIVGGGTSGCILASNLAKYASVLLVEAGGVPPIETELAGLFQYLKQSRYDWNFTATHSKNTSPYHNTGIQQGKVLGGSAQVNYMIHGIGNPKDYDEWATVTNDSSWSFKNICPLFKRTEKVIDKVVLESTDIVFHGTDGPIQIKKYHSKINDPYFQSYEELGYNVVTDINPNNTLGFTPSYFTIGHHYRQSTAYKFLSPEKDNPNLHVMYDSLATKITFDENKNAVGVRILTNDNKYITVKAKREVIVTAGTIKSPHLLLLSGIGPKKHLEHQKIKVISDLPVGRNLQDHATCTLVYKMGKEKRAGPLNLHDFPVNVIAGYVALNESQGRADYQVLSGVIADPTFFLQVCVFTFDYSKDLCNCLYNSVAGRELHFVVHRLLHPESRGSIHLKSRNPKDNPVVYPQYYSNAKDLENHAKYVEHFNAVLNTTFYKSVNAELVDPKLRMCDGLKRGTKAYWRCYVRGMATSLHDYVGTCAMGSVVDSNLCVKGVGRLRVADASVMHKIVGSTVQATVMMIAQKLIDVLIKLYNFRSK